MSPSLSAKQTSVHVRMQIRPARASRYKTQTTERRGAKMIKSDSLVSQPTAAQRGELLLLALSACVFCDCKSRQKTQCSSSALYKTNKRCLKDILGRLIYILSKNCVFSKAMCNRIRPKCTNKVQTSKEIQIFIFLNPTLAAVSFSQNTIKLKLLQAYETLW